MKIMLVTALFARSGMASISAMEEDFSDAPSNWAFDPSSRELELVIIKATPSFATNGYIAIFKANVHMGMILVQGKGITGTMNGIENFTQVSSINLSNNNLSGELPKSFSNLTSLTSVDLRYNNLSGNLPDISKNEESFRLLCGS